MGSRQPRGLAPCEYWPLLTSTCTNASKLRFRQDLYFRLARFPVTAPPLRERKEDISALVGHFIALFATEMGVDAPQLSPEALAVLEEYAFPGNVRELKNIMERAMIESAGRDIGPEHVHFFFPTSGSSTASDTPLSFQAATGEGMAQVPLNLAEAERILINRALEQAEGNISKAARLLGTNRPHIYRALKREEAQG